MAGIHRRLIRFRANGDISAMGIDCDVRPLARYHALGLQLKVRARNINRDFVSRRAINEPSSLTAAERILSGAPIDLSSRPRAQGEEIAKLHPMPTKRLLLAPRTSQGAERPS